MISVEVAMRGRLGHQVHTRFDDSFAIALCAQAVLYRRENFLCGHLQSLDVVMVQISKRQGFGHGGCTRIEPATNFTSGKRFA
jgi:hypothetical protein